MQIVNGCQTATALALAEKDGKLAPDTRVMLRIYETADAQLVDKIVLTTNNQNKISSRDLRSNDKVQIDMQEAFSKYGLFYERKINQYGAQTPANRIVVNELVAQSYLGIVLKKPSDARRRKYKVWGELYDKIFSSEAVEPYVIAMLLHNIISAWLEDTKLTQDSNDLRRKIANNGVFHIARVGSYLWRGTDSWDQPTEELKKRIETLQKSAGTLAPVFETAFKVLEGVLAGKEHYKSDLDAALKTATLDTDLDKAVHTNS